MLVIVLCMVAMAQDAPTSLRQSLNPYVLYNFMDADLANGPVSYSNDLSNHPTIKFGNLTLGSRATWLKGRPGVHLAAETGSSVTAAMSSNNNYQTSWTPTFNNAPFVFEIWYQFKTIGPGSFWSVARTNTQSGVAGSCNLTEPLFIMMRDTSDIQTKCSLTDNPRPCAYAMSLTVSQSTYITAAMYGRYSAVPNDKLETTGFEGTTQSNYSIFSGRTNLVWQDAQAHLLFSSSNSGSNLDFNMLSFAIYPNIDDNQIVSLFNAGLPNAKPFAPTFQRSVPETVGGAIRLCPNVAMTPRDSDCLDYTNNATHLGLGQIHSLVPSASLTVWITSLPAAGVLSHLGNPITMVPFKLSSNNTVYFTPNPDTSNWWATYISSAYTFYKNSTYASFAYYVVDSDGAQSNTATVSLEVYPTHKSPLVNDVSNTNVYAGRPLSASSFDNIIKFSVANRDFLSPGPGRQNCSGDSTTPMCTALADRPNPMQTVVTIKSLSCPTCFKVKDWGTGTFSTASVGTQIVANRTWCGSVDCTETYWTIFWEAPLSMFNSTAEILGNATLTYTATDYFNLAGPLGSTTQIVDAVGTTTSVNWQTNTESNVATVVATIYNGFYAQSGTSVVKQRNQTTIAPQRISLVAADYTMVNPSITLYVTSLPARGGLFDVGSTTQITTVPHVIPSGSNFSLDYQPSLPTESFGFVSSPTYATFQFYAVSNTRSSNTATQTISVVDTNDKVTIAWYGPSNADGEMVYSAPTKIPQSWGDLPDNNLYINWTDPDVEVAGEPWYNIKLGTVTSEFTIFLNPQYYAEINAFTDGTIGYVLGPGGPGQGSPNWEVVVNRTLARLLLNPLRLRPNKPTGSSLSVQIKDCIMVNNPASFRTATQFSNNPTDWSSETVLALIPLRGDIKKADEYQGVADPTILGVVYGVAAFIGVVLLICGIMIVRWCLRKSRGGGGGGGHHSSSTKSTSGGSSSKKGGKKAKSAYLHTVEL